jgi:hypothetical protein
MDVNTDNNILGIKVATAVAGFFGGVICLSWLRGLTQPQAAMAVLTGAVTAAYGTPALMYYLHWSAPLENFAAFFIGLTAMNSVPAMIELSRLFRNNPTSFLRRGGDDK